MDVVDSQNKRKLAIGSHATAYSQAEIKSIAIYSAPITADQVKSSYEKGTDLENASLSAYYDYDMPGNTSELIKDQTGNGHDGVYTRVFYEREEPVKEFDYSFAFVGDTQKLVIQDANNGTSYSSYIYDWIVANKENKKIQHVFGLGDITDKNYDTEWEIAVKLHEKLEGANIPYGIIPGNHDGTNGYVKYNTYFGSVPYFTDRIDEYYEDGRVENYAMKFEVGSHKYMLVALQYLPPDDVLAWANDVIAANPDRRVIVTTHWFLSSDGTWSDDTTGDTNRGKQIWDKLLSQHSNIIMAVGGHVVVNDIKHRTDVGVNGNTVHTFLIDPQGLDPAQSYQTGMVAIFHFSENGSEVQVEYISSYRTLEAQKTDPESEDILYHECNQFSFTLPDASAIARYTKYGPLPESCDPAVYKFALFSEGKFINGFKTWGEAVTGIDAEFTKNANKELQLLLLDDCENADFTPDVAAFNNANGLLTVDLDCYKLTASDTLFSFNASDTANTNAVDIVIKNGTIVVKNASVIENSVSENYTGSKVWNVSFENVTVDLTASTLGESVPLFNLSDGNANGNRVNLKVNGGEIHTDVATLNTTELYTVDANDTILFGKYDGAYTKLVTGTTAKDYSHYSEPLPTADGNKYFVEISDNGATSVYELRSLTITSGDKQFTFELASKVKYLSVVDYPFVVFDSTGKFYGGYDYFLGANDANSAIGSAITNITTAINDPNNNGTIIENPVDAYVLMRSDYTTKILSSGSHESYNKYTYARGNVIIDMCGYTLTQHPDRADSVNSGFIFDCEIRKASYPSNFTVKNGIFEIYDSAVIRFRSRNADSNVKVISWTFDNVNFGLANGTDTAQRFFHFSGASGTTSIATVTLNLNDCVYDIYSVPSNKSQFTVFGQRLWEAAYLKANINVNGGKILAKNLDKFLKDGEVTFSEEYFTAGSGLGPTLRVAPGSDGEYLKLVIPTSESTSDAFATFEAITLLTNDGKALGFGLSAKDDINNIYSLYAPTVTDYGTIPSKYGSTELYPFAVFKDGEFVGAYENWGTDATASALHSSKAAGSIVLLRRDYVYNQSNNYNNLSQTRDNTIIDLGGFTFDASKKYMFNAQKKTNYNTKITVKNGTIIVGATALMSVDTDKPDVYTGGYGFDFIFDGITVKIVANSKTGCVMTWNKFASSDKDQFLNLTFNNCVFDLSAATKDLVLFHLSDAHCKNTVVINGGEIITSGYGLTIARIDGGHAETTLAFGKNTDGDYTILSIPTDTSVIENSFMTADGVECVFIKVSENEEYVNYSLYPKAMVGYKIKTSVTLWSNFVYNIYIPKANVNSFTINGVAMAYEESEIDGVTHYHVAVNLPAGETLQDIKVSVKLNSGDTTVDANWTLNVLNYTKSVINGSYDDTTKTLMKDMLVYANAAYTYFGNTLEAEKLSEVVALLEGYTKEMPTGEAKKPTDKTYFTDVAVYLGEVPSFRFTLADGYTADDFTFKVGNRNATVIAGDGYVEIVMYAYMMLDDVTFTVNGTEVTESYNLYAYYNYAKTLNNANLTAIVEALMKYSVSAKAYRESVIN